MRGVEKRYGALQALAGVTLAVRQGEFFGLLGPNGAGKTTLINIIAGLARASSGSVAVLGADVLADYRRARRMLGVVPQELVFDPFFSVRETLRLQSGYFGIRGNDAWIDEVMHHLDLDAKAEANMRSLSGGMKRRVLVAQALVHKPPVIVLDEPTAGVDVELRQALWRFVRRLNRDGHTIVLTTHYLEEAETLCGRIAMLKQGRIVALDTKQNLLRLHSGCYVELRLQRHTLREMPEPVSEAHHHARRHEVQMAIPVEVGDHVVDRPHRAPGRLGQIGRLRIDPLAKHPALHAGRAVETPPQRERRQRPYGRGHRESVRLPWRTGGGARNLCARPERLSCAGAGAFLSDEWRVTSGVGATVTRLRGQKSRSDNTTGTETSMGLLINPSAKQSRASAAKTGVTTAWNSANSADRSRALIQGTSPPRRQGRRIPGCWREALLHAGFPRPSR